MFPAGDGQWPCLVVLGSGFGGYSLAASLPSGLFRVIVVSPRNYFLFTPLLPAAVAGTVEFRSILEPTRRRLRRLGELRIIEAEAVSLDAPGRRLSCRGAVDGEPFELGYDLLAIAPGARVADFGIAGVREHALTLASVQDARAIRRRVLAQFARAEIPGRTEEEIRRLLTFVVCGAGPTGVEVAAELDDLLARELAELHPETAGMARVVVLEATERILGGFDRLLADYAREQFRREGVEIRTSAAVESIAADRVRLAGGEEMPCGLTIWAGGNAPAPFIEALDGVERQKGRIVVDEFLRVPGLPGVYALGDCAAFGDPPVPATAQVAQQQGRYLARALARQARGKSVAPFRFKPAGMLAYIGGGKALADLPRVKWGGRSAWLFWRSVYFTKLVSLANKVKVLFDWMKARLLGRDLSRF